MKLELKNIKHTQWASEETHCYQAALYVDGKPVAIVSNDGHGGCDRDYDHPKFKGDYRATMKAVHAYFKTLPNTDACDLFPDGMAQELEFWCSDQVNEFLNKKHIMSNVKRILKKVSFMQDGKLMQFGTNVKPSTMTFQQIRRHDTSLKDVKFLNEMTLDEVATIVVEMSA
tara:strand:+ start:136 stop:648 length:513 start_codon:yes stop_codon:yes gene_type:complete